MTDIKYFRGATVREALRQVREALGPDAVIVTQRKRGGLVEIAASVDMPQSPSSSSAHSPAARGEARQSPALFTERLQALGFDDHFIDRILLDNDPSWTAALECVQANLPVRAMPTLLSQGRLRFIGPPGAGKTSTIIKLAANHVLRFGADQIGIITQDNSRLAGSEQLMLAGELLGIKVVETNTEDELARALLSMTRKRLVLIDTPGTTGRGEDIRALGVLPGVETFLVFPATLQPGVILRLSSATRALMPAGVVLTQVDAAVTVGEALSACVATGLQICWVGTGADLPEGIESAASALLMDMVLKSEENAPGTTSEQRSAPDSLQNASASRHLGSDAAVDEAAATTKTMTSAKTMTATKAATARRAKGRPIAIA